MPRVLKVRMQTRHAESGELLGEEWTEFQLLDPPSTACQMCGKDPAHAPDQPHDGASMFYQYAFYAEHTRWPTWKDAIAHCDDATKAAWEAELRKRGYWPADEAVS